MNKMLSKMLVIVSSILLIVMALPLEKQEVDIVDEPTYNNNILSDEPTPENTKF